MSCFLLYNLIKVFDKDMHESENVLLNSYNFVSRKRESENESSSVWFKTISSVYFSSELFNTL